MPNEDSVRPKGGCRSSKRPAKQFGYLLSLVNEIRGCTCARERSSETDFKGLSRGSAQVESMSAKFCRWNRPNLIDLKSGKGVAGPWHHLGTVPAS
jgi:hypothetical protein